MLEIKDRRQVHYCPRCGEKLDRESEEVGITAVDSEGRPSPVTTYTFHVECSRHGRIFVG